MWRRGGDYPAAMATWDDVRHVALGLPDSSEGTSHDGVLAWRVRDKLFVWERPLRKVDIEALAEDVPDGPIVATVVPDVSVKEALCAAEPEVFFTTPHFDGYPAILILLERIGPSELEEMIIEAWLEKAPKTLAQSYLAALG
ncbi:MmcQ/YjbR family DNA-binding protein [soil metagenome]